MLAVADAAAAAAADESERSDAWLGKSRKQSNRK